MKYSIDKIENNIAILENIETKEIINKTKTLQINFDLQGLFICDGIKNEVQSISPGLFMCLFDNYINCCGC